MNGNYISNFSPFMEEIYCQLDFRQFPLTMRRQETHNCFPAILVEDVPRFMRVLFKLNRAVRQWPRDLRRDGHYARTICMRFELSEGVSISCCVTRETDPTEDECRLAAAYVKDCNLNRKVMATVRTHAAYRHFVVDVVDATAHPCSSHDCAVATCASRRAETGHGCFVYDAMMTFPFPFVNARGYVGALHEKK